MYNEYKPFHHLNNKIYSYQSPYSIEPESLIIAEINSYTTLIKFNYFSKLKLMVSIFINATEKENNRVNLTENL